MDMARLKAVRQAAPMSQQELADAAGLSKGTIVALEAGRTRARPGTARKLAAALGCDHTALLDRVELGEVLQLQNGGVPAVIVIEQGAAT